MEDPAKPQEQQESGAGPQLAIPPLAPLTGMGPIRISVKLLEYLQNLPVDEAILLCFSVLGAQATRSLGISPNGPLPEWDPDEAQLAINAMSGLLQSTDSYLPYEEVKTMREIVEQLRSALEDAQSTPRA